MYRSSLFRIVSALAAVSCVWSTSAPVFAAAPADYSAVAERIVGQCVNVREGDRVVIQGDVRDLDLVEEMVIAVVKRGGDALQLVAREGAALRYFKEVPAAFDAAPFVLHHKLVEAQTVMIEIQGQENPALFREVDPIRFNTVIQKFAALGDSRMKKGVRSVVLGNGLYPTEATAKNYGLTKDQLAELFWNGINVDYSRLQGTCASVQAILSKGKEVHVTDPNGTDLKFRIEARPVFSSDGVISAEDVAKGGPATLVFLPAGEVYVAPVPGTAEGRLTFGEAPFEGGVIRDATFVFKSGKLVSHSAKPGPEYDRWKALYDAAPAGKEEFGFLDLGTNPNVKIPSGSRLRTWVASGTVTLGTGANTWAGGSVEAVAGFTGNLVQSTVRIDGKPVVENGVLKVP